MTSQHWHSFHLTLGGCTRRAAVSTSTRVLRPSELSRIGRTLGVPAHSPPIRLRKALHQGSRGYVSPEGECSSHHRMTRSAMLRHHHTAGACVHTIVGACSGAATRITQSVENSGKTPSAVQRIVNAPTGTTNRVQPHSLTCRSRRVHSHAPRLIPREAS